MTQRMLFSLSLFSNEKFEENGKHEAEEIGIQQEFPWKEKDISNLEA